MEITIGHIFIIFIITWVILFIIRYRKARNSYLIYDSSDFMEDFTLSCCYALIIHLVIAGAFVLIHIFNVPIIKI